MLNNKSLFTWVSLVACTFLLSASSAWAQTFQNSNTACESELVLCSSVPPPPPAAQCFGEAQSLACKNISGPADFNGDGFADCAASVDNGPTSGPGIDVSTLFNNTGSSCGNQFAPTIDDGLTGLAGGDFTRGSILVGPLAGGGNSGLAVPGAPFNKNLVSALSVPGVPNPALGTDNDNWEEPGADQSIFPSNFSDRNAALIDCNNDGNLDAAIAVADITDGVTGDVKLNILINDGTGIQPILAGGSFSTGVSFAVDGGFGIASLAVADFGGVGGQDVALAIRTDEPSPNANTVVVCLNNGSCGFTCLAPLNLDAQHGGASTNPFSIAAGDFDGNGTADVVVSEPGVPGPAAFPRGIHYYFGNGDGTLAVPGTHVTYNTPAGGTPGVLTTGFFNNDFIVDVALNYGSPPPNGIVITGNVGVFMFNSTSGAFDVETLSYGAGIIGNQGGIDAADFDNQGCDDIMALASVFGATLQRRAYVFMNGIETMTANAGTDQVVNLNTPIALSGTCTLEPADPNAALNISWTVSPATGATITNPNTLNPTVTLTENGTYTFTLTCDTQCTGPQTDTVTLVSNQICTAEGSGCIGDNGQGPNICSLVGSPMTGAQSFSIAQWIGTMILPGGVFLAIRRKRKKA